MPEIHAVHATYAIHTIHPIHTIRTIKTIYKILASRQNLQYIQYTVQTIYRIYKIHSICKIHTIHAMRIPRAIHTGMWVVEGNNGVYGTDAEWQAAVKEEIASSLQRDPSSFDIKVCKYIYYDAIHIS